MSGIIVIVKAENQTLKKATEKTEQGSRATREWRVDLRYRWANPEMPYFHEDQNE
jgi:hypothetical protein